MLLFAYENELLELSAITLISGPLRITPSVAVIQHYGQISGGQFQLQQYQPLVTLAQSKETQDKVFRGE